MEQCAHVASNKEMVKKIQSCAVFVPYEQPNERKDNKEKESGATEAVVIVLNLLRPLRCF